MNIKKLGMLALMIVLAIGVALISGYVQAPDIPLLEKPVEPPEKPVTPVITLPEKPQEPLGETLPTLPCERTFYLDYGDFTFSFPENLGGGRSKAIVSGAFTLLAEATDKSGTASLELIDIDEKISSLSMFLDVDEDGKIDTIATGEMSLTMENIILDLSEGELDLKTGDFSLTFLMSPKVPLFEELGIEFEPFKVTETGRIDFKTGYWNARGSGTISMGFFKGVTYLFGKGGKSEKECPDKCPYKLTVKTTELRMGIKGIATLTKSEKPVKIKTIYIKNESTKETGHGDTNEKGQLQVGHIIAKRIQSVHNIVFEVEICNKKCCRWEFSPKEAREWTLKKGPTVGKCTLK